MSPGSQALEKGKPQNFLLVSQRRNLVLPRERQNLVSPNLLVSPRNLVLPRGRDEKKCSDFAVCVYERDGEEKKER